MNSTEKIILRAIQSTKAALNAFDHLPRNEQFKIQHDQLSTAAAQLEEILDNLPAEEVGTVAEVISSKPVLSSAGPGPDEKGEPGPIGLTGPSSPIGVQVGQFDTVKPIGPVGVPGPVGPVDTGMAGVPVNKTIIGTVGVNGIDGEHGEHGVPANHCVEEVEVTPVVVGKQVKNVKGTKGEK